MTRVHLCHFCSNYKKTCIPVLNLAGNVNLPNEQTGKSTTVLNIPFVFDIFAPSIHAIGIIKSPYMN